MPSIKVSLCLRNPLNIFMAAGLNKTVSGFATYMAAKITEKTGDDKGLARM